jgi:hypothetical protein
MRKSLLDRRLAAHISGRPDVPPTKHLASVAAAARAGVREELGRRLAHTAAHLRISSIDHRSLSSRAASPSGTATFRAGLRAKEENPPPQSVPARTLVIPPTDISERGGAPETSYAFARKPLRQVPGTGTARKSARFTTTQSRGHTRVRTLVLISSGIPAILQEDGLTFTDCIAGNQLASPRRCDF